MLTIWTNKIKHSTVGSSFSVTFSVAPNELEYLNKLYDCFSSMNWSSFPITADRKTEPQTNADQHVQRVEYIGNDEKSRCWTCKHFERLHETPIASDGNYYTYVVCTAKECHYEPQTEPQYDAEEVAKDINRRVDMVKKEWNARHIEDEPQTETEIAKAIVHKMIDDAVIAEDAYPDLRQKMHDAVDEYEPQTDCAWK